MTSTVMYFLCVMWMIFITLSPETAAYMIENKAGSLYVLRSEYGYDQIKSRSSTDCAVRLKHENMFRILKR